MSLGFPNTRIDENSLNELIQYLLSSNGITQGNMTVYDINGVKLWLKDDEGK